MSALADLEIALRRDRKLSLLAESHVHRAVREDSLGIIKGRDAIQTAWVNEEPADVVIDADLGDMIAYTAGGWHGHRCVWREDGRIVREVVVEDRGRPRAAPPEHPPLGELRLGEGQYATGSTAILPPGFADAARPLADRLHRAWNGRALDLYDGAWLTELLRQLPDASFTFERGIATGDAIALLWRVQGHHANGQRVRLIGSTVMAGERELTVFDQAAMKAQLQRPLIDYSHP